MSVCHPRRIVKRKRYWWLYLVNALKYFFLDYLERTTGARLPGKGHMPTKRQKCQQSVLKGMSFFRSVSIRDRSKCAMWPGTLENTGWNFPVVGNVVLLIQGTTKKKKKEKKKEEEKRKQSVFFMESSITSKQKKSFSTKDVDSACFCSLAKTFIWRIIRKTGSIYYRSFSFDFVYLKLKTNMKMIKNCGEKWERLGL